MITALLFRSQPAHVLPGVAATLSISFCSCDAIQRRGKWRKGEGEVAPDGLRVKGMMRMAKVEVGHTSRRQSGKGENCARAFKCMYIRMAKEGARRNNSFFVLPSTCPFLGCTTGFERHCSPWPVTRPHRVARSSRRHGCHSNAGSVKRARLLSQAQPTHPCLTAESIMPVAPRRNANKDPTADMSSNTSL